jgi:hypothetical protein
MLHGQRRQRLKRHGQRRQRLKRHGQRDSDDNASGDTADDTGTTDDHESSGDDGGDGGDEGGYGPPSLFVYDEVGSEEIGPAREVIELPYGSAEQIQSGDFDGDDVVDVLACGSESTLVLGAGGDTPNLVDAQASFPGTMSPLGLGVADLDADGYDDVFRHDDMDLEAYVLWSDGQGGFTEASLGQFRPGFGMTGLAARPAFGDLDADGNRDIVICFSTSPTDAGEDGSVAIFLGHGMRAFELVPVVPLAPPDVIDRGYDCGAPTLTDVDGDGNVDLLLLGRFQRYQEGDDRRDFVAVSKGRGDGTLDPMETYPAKEHVSGRGRFGDIDGDGHVDAVVFPNSGVWVSRGREDGSFGGLELLTDLAQGTPGPLDHTAGGFTLADVTGDGLTDIAWAAEGALGLVPGQEDGSVGSPIQGSWDAAHTGAQASADLDGDGDHEIFAVMSDFE